MTSVRVTMGHIATVSHRKENIRTAQERKTGKRVHFGLGLVELLWIQRLREPQYDGHKRGNAHDAQEPLRVAPGGVMRRQTAAERSDCRTDHRGLFESENVNDHHRRRLRRLTPTNTPMAYPRSSSRYISPMTPAPMDIPLEAPKAWTTRQNMSVGTEYELATPIEPTQRHGKDLRYTKRRPSTIMRCDQRTQRGCVKSRFVHSHMPEYVAQIRPPRAVVASDKLTAKLSRCQNKDDSVAKWTTIWESYLTTEPEVLRSLAIPGKEGKN